MTAHEIDQAHLERKYTLRQNMSVWLNVALISLSFVSISSLIIYAGYKLDFIENLARSAAEVAVKDLSLIHI